MVRKLTIAVPLPEPDMDQEADLQQQVTQGAMEPPGFSLPIKQQQAVEGEHVIFSCVITGVPAPDVQWFHNEQNVKDKEDFVVAYDEETGHCELVIVQCYIVDAGQYHCVATNPVGETVTTAELSVLSAAEALAGGDRDVAASLLSEQVDFVEDDLPMVTAESTEELEVPPDGVLEEDILPELTERKALPAEAAPSPTDDYPMITGLETCPSEPESVVEEEAVVTPREFIIDDHRQMEQSMDVVATEAQQHSEPAQFIKPIQPVIVMEGRDATFTALVSGHPLPTVNWLRDEVMLDPSDRVVMALDERTHVVSLTTREAQQADFGNYTCIAVNPSGQAKCTANLVIVRKYQAMYQKERKWGKGLAVILIN